MLIAYKDTRNGFSDPNLRRDVMHISDQILLLLANRPPHIRNDLVECITIICDHLLQLGRINPYIKGPDFVKEFNAHGNQIIEEINNAYAMIEKTIHAAGDVDATK